jgi:electron transfer flavoprotein beta subunit
VTAQSVKCVLAFKWARNPLDARVGFDGAVDWSFANMAASDDDAAAAAAARNLSDDIVALTVGNGDTAWAAARGASCTVTVPDPQIGLDSSWTARLLAGGVRYIGKVDVVLAGDCAWDTAVPVLLGACLGWPTLAGVIEARREGGALRVVRRAESGNETLEVRPPVVLAVLARHAEKEPPGMKAILAARKKPVEKMTAADLGAAPSADSLVLRGSALPPATKAQIFAGQDPAGAAARLIAALRKEGVL